MHLALTTPENQLFNLLSAEEWRQVSEWFGLTCREQEVCKLLFQCLTRREIAAELGIKERTVRGYMEQIHIKLNGKSRVGVVLRIIEARDA